MGTAYIMIITKKNQVSKGVRNMGAKAMSWSQVCKQLSGMGGYVEIAKDEKVRPLELMQSLGVHVAKNSYKPNDIFTAWNAWLKKGETVQIMRSVPFKVEINGKEYALYAEKGEKAIYHHVLCQLVSMSDKAKGSNDVIVNVNNVLRGLQQSAFISDTLSTLKKSAEKCAAITSGWVNVAEKRTDVPVWVEVARYDDGWDLKRYPKVEVVVKAKGRNRKAA